MKKIDLLEILLKSIKDNTNIEIKQNQYDENLTDLGIDSIFAIEIANDMEDALDIVIDDRDIVKFETINLIVEYFEKFKKENKLL
jgi:acyl carrier protein